MNIIEQIIAAKPGDKDFVLCRGGEASWWAAIGGKSQHVHISEDVLYGPSNADFYAEATTADDALTALLAKVQAG